MKNHSVVNKFSEHVWNDFVASLAELSTDFQSKTDYKANVLTVRASAMPEPALTFDSLIILYNMMFNYCIV